MTTHAEERIAYYREQLRQNVAFKAALEGEREVADAIKPLQKERAALEKQRADLIPKAAARRELEITEQQNTVADKAYETWNATKVAALAKIAGRDTSPDWSRHLPPERVPGTTLLVTKITQTPREAGATFLLPHVEEAENDSENYVARAVVKEGLDVLKTRPSTPDVARPIGEPDPVEEIIARAEAVLIDDQVYQGIAGQQLIEELRSQMHDVVDQVKRTGSVEDRTQAIAPGGEIVERPRRRDLTPAEGLTTPEPEGAV